LELQEALAALQKEEDAYNAKTEDLKKKTTQGGVVSQGRAKNELAQHLAEDVRRKEIPSSLTSFSLSLFHVQKLQQKVHKFSFQLFITFVLSGDKGEINV